MAGPDVLFDMNDDQRTWCLFLATLRAAQRNGIRFSLAGGEALETEASIIRALQERPGDLVEDKSGFVERVTVKEIYDELAAPILAKYAEVRRLYEAQAKGANLTLEGEPSPSPDGTTPTRS